MSKVDTSDFIRKMNALGDAWKKIPDEIAATAVNFSKERFREQSWLDSTKENWKPRAMRRRGGKTKSQTLLVNTGRGKRGMRKILANENQVIIGNDVPYMFIQNEGGVINKTVTVKQFQKKEYTRQRKGRTERVKSHTIQSHQRKMNVKIPSRRFIGNSLTLERRIYLLIASRFAKALKQ